LASDLTDGTDFSPWTTDGKDSILGIGLNGRNGLFSFGIGVNGRNGLSISWDIFI
jgi:hypothetical protein